MNVGIPGTGVGGLFFVLCAILAVPVEVVQTVRGRSSRQRWRQALYHALVATGMVGALVASYALLHALLGTGSTGGTGARATRGFSNVIPVAPVLLAAAVLTAVLVAAAATHFVLRRRETRATLEVDSRSQAMPSASFESSGLCRPGRSLFGYHRKTTDELLARAIELLEQALTRLGEAERELACYQERESSRSEGGAATNGGVHPEPGPATQSERPATLGRTLKRPETGAGEFEPNGQSAPSKGSAVPKNANPAPDADAVLERLRPYLGAASQRTRTTRP